ncbi:MAG: peptidyl-alpha-hydroxyglycine alpha-amidating lyase family protein [Acidobacteria bacterium]|nr:peptidyl-alpha-hydroxyglycine alpha-amidating lyase family protein [Acidobacteriota bacterium]
MQRTFLLGLFVVLLAFAAGPNLFTTHANQSYEVVHGWPQLPEGFALGQTTGVEVDSKNRVLVFHRGARPILAFDGKSGNLLASFGDGLFGSAHGLTVDHEDNIWVTDASRHTVHKFSPDGKLLMSVGAADVPGVDGSHFNRPTDVAVAPNADIYIADGYGNRRIVHLNSSGEFIREWGTEGSAPGQFVDPHGLALDPDGNVYVADRGNSRIQVFTKDGKFIKEWKSKELGRPWGLDIDSKPFLFVADGGDLHPQPPERNRILKLDLNGKILEAWGSFGSYDGQFYWAHDVAAGDDGAVYVTDVNVGMRVQKFVKP